MRFILVFVLSFVGGYVLGEFVHNIWVALPICFIAAAMIDKLVDWILSNIKNPVTK